MIDWVSAVLPYPHSRVICDGGKIYVDRDGVCSQMHPKGASVEGSWSSKCLIQSSREHPDLTHIYVSGSPKFLQGHNLFGPGNPVGLCIAMAQKALRSLGRHVPRSVLKRWMAGDIKFTRLDVTEMLDVGSEANVSAFMRAACDHLRVSHRNGVDGRDGTLYVGKHSRYSSLKLYGKLQELESRSKKHRLPIDFPEFEKLMDYARGTVRAEWVLRSMELKRQSLSSGRDWLRLDAREVWSRYMAKIEMQGNVPLRERQLEKIPRWLLGTYTLWSERRDIGQLLPRRTFYRHRKALREFGIDISTVPAAKDRANVVPLIRVIEARPKGIPGWAFGTPLLAA